MALRGLHRATAGRTEGCNSLLQVPLFSLSISAHSCPVEHPTLELLSVIYSQINELICLFLHHFHKLQSKWCDLPLILGYLYEGMGKWNGHMHSRKSRGMPLVVGIQRARSWELKWCFRERRAWGVIWAQLFSSPEERQKASQVEQAAGSHQNMFSSLLLESLNETTVE